MYQDSYIDVVKIILIYLKETVGDGLVYGKSDDTINRHQLIKFIDAN